MAYEPGAETPEEGQTRQRPAYLAAALVGTSGLVGISAALPAIVLDPYYLLVDGDVYRVDLTGWGWVRLVVGVVATIAGLAIVAAKPRWSMRFGVAAAALGTLAALVSFPYQPLQAMLEVPAYFAAVWLLLRRG